MVLFVYMLKNIGAVVGGFVAASVVMMVCEMTNSLIFPFPAGFDQTNLEQVRAFAATLPWTAYILVLLGWFLGSVVGGWISSRIVRAKTFTVAGIVGGILTVAGIFNNVMLKAPVLVFCIGFIVFFLGTWLGYQAHQKRSLK